jgi:rubrerythrin
LIQRNERTGFRGHTETVMRDRSGTIAVSRLSSLPSGPILSARALLELARAMEARAARRYRELAARMRLGGEERLAGIFDFFAGIEDKHAQQIEERSRRLPAERVSDVGLPQSLPEEFDDEEGDSRLLTPYRALAIAVRNEERAFAFYSHAAAAAAGPEVRAFAEGLARDELVHAALLRRERRKAWRAERPAGPPLRPPEPPATIAELRAVAGDVEWRAAACHRALADILARQDDALAALFAELAGDEERAARESGQPRPEGRTAAAVGIADGLRVLEEAFERYAEVAGQARDEAILAEAQRLSAGIVERLAAIGRATARTTPIARRPGVSARPT